MQPLLLRRPRNCRRSQALSYFVKPYPYDAVVKKIRQVIEARSQ
jgi:hypothetical protein